MRYLDFETLLSLYKLGERKFQGLLICSADALECNLHGIDLKGSAFIGAYLPYANLSQANLQSLTLKDGNLGDVRLPLADMRKAIFVGTDLSRADLRYACLREANLQSVNLFGADLSGADLSGADLSGAVLSRANFAQANLNRVCLKGANLFRARRVDLVSAICDRTTILPDGHYYSGVRFG